MFATTALALVTREITGRRWWLAGAFVAAAAIGVRDVPDRVRQSVHYGRTRPDQTAFVGEHDGLEPVTQLGHGHLAGARRQRQFASA